MHPLKQCLRQLAEQPQAQLPKQLFHQAVCGVKPQLLHLLKQCLRQLAEQPQAKMLHLLKQRLKQLIQQLADQGRVQLCKQLPGLTA